MNESEAALAAALAQTGFPFEHHIFEQSARQGWTTIPNRLYIDAEEEKTREMDLLCYRADKGAKQGSVTVYTSLLISCKARNDKPWVMMTRPWPKQRPSWYAYPPVPTWTNSAPLRHELALQPWGLEYFNNAGEAGLREWSEDSREEVFALQEFEALKDAKGRKPVRFKSLNDTSLYMGAMSLLKALAYELNALGQRRGNETASVVYQFNLIQLLDGELYEASFATGQPVVVPVKRYRYFARTMLNGKELSARIDFCTRAALPTLLEDMAKLHRFNVGLFTDKYNHFWSTCLYNQTKIDVLLPLLEPRLRQLFGVFFGKSPRPGPGWVQVNYDQAEDTLKAELDCPMDFDTVGANESFLSLARKAVRDVYKFQGKVLIEESDIPF